MVEPIPAIFVTVVKCRAVARIFFNRGERNFGPRSGVGFLGRGSECFARG